uniref:Uncharacterized protein n=1 Tax=Acrobeloides nanus TaxID=290746 RepID=A0A914DN18_9BILA
YDCHLKVQNRRSHCANGNDRTKRDARQKTPLATLTTKTKLTAIAESATTQTVSTQSVPSTTNMSIVTTVPMTTLSPNNCYDEDKPHIEEWVSRLEVGEFF